MALSPSLYEPLCVSVTEHVTVNTLYDVRRVKKDGTYPVYIRVCCRHDKLYLPTGISLSPEDYAKALIVKTGSTKICKAKAQIGQCFKKVNDEFRNASMRVAIRQSAAHPVSEFLGTCMIVIVLWFGGYLIFSGNSPIDASGFIYYLVILTL